MQADALLPTVPQTAIPPPSLSPPPKRGSPWLPIILVGTLVVGLVIGLAIGRGTSPAVVAPPAPPASVDVGHLDVSSKPIDGNVLVDGRFVGVAPIERVDLDPGKHSIVIDAFGYQPYAGTLDIAARGQINLRVTLAPIGGDGSTSGNVTGGGKATAVTIPATALLPPIATPRATAPTPPARASRVAAPPADPPSMPAPAPPPPRPRRDCSGEKSRCRDGCSRASTSCSFSCPGCGSCNTSVGWDECKRQCDSCKSSCEQNTKFCESGCDSNYDSCNYSSE